MSNPENKIIVHNSPVTNLVNVYPGNTVEDEVRAYRLILADMVKSGEIVEPTHQIPSALFQYVDLTSNEIAGGLPPNEQDVARYAVSMYNTILREYESALIDFNNVMRILNDQIPLFRERRRFCRETVAQFHARVESEKMVEDIRDWGHEALVTNDGVWTETTIHEVIDELDPYTWNKAVTKTTLS